MIDKMPMECIFKRIKSIYFITYLVVCITVPILVIILAYSRILVYSYKIRFARTNSINLATSSNESLSGSNLFNNFRHVIEAVDLAKSLFITFMLFSVCW